MSQYSFRFSFDPGSGICLWAANDAARVKWGYPVSISELSLPENVCRLAHHIVAWYDTSIDWDCPSAPSPWTDVERARFNEEAQGLLTALRRQLGHNFDIRDESATADAV
jgi:hypothetical protein